MESYDRTDGNKTDSLAVKLLLWQIMCNFWEAILVEVAECP